MASRKIELGELTRDTIIFGDAKGKKQTKKGEGDGTTAGEILLMKSRPEVVNAFLAEYAPPVLDPFCGGGSIPLEAQRLGLRAYGSDLNPVPVLITKALIEIPPKFAGRPPVNPDWQTKSKEAKAATAWQGAQGLAADVRYYGQWMRNEAEKRIGHLYPKVKVTKEMAKDRPDLNDYVGQELTVIAWLWARTVASPNPTCRGIHVPLIRSYWLGTKKGRETWVQPVIDSKTSTYSFSIRRGKPSQNFSPNVGTVTRTGANCLLTGVTIAFEYIREEAKAGRMGQRLMGIVALGTNERVYLPPCEEHERTAKAALPENVPDTPIPEQALGFRVQLYGMTRHCDLFTKRQLVALGTFADLVLLAERHINSQDPEYRRGIATYLGLAASKMADGNSTICTWMSGVKYEVVRTTFSRQALPITWDFAESNPFAGSSGDYAEQVSRTSKSLELATPANGFGEVSQLDAIAPRQTPIKAVVSTDPPYYDNIGYADLSDYFYVWLRRALSSMYPTLFATLLTPKNQELIATPYRHSGSRNQAQEFFETGLGHAFARMHDVQEEDVPLTVYYAFKQSETTEDEDESVDNNGVPTTASTGWETMLAGLVRSGFSITGTWPMRTERSVRSVGIGTNALASSIILVCRSRSPNAPLATRKEFLTTLRNELPESLKDLQHGNIAPVDLAQASIGPGMSTFTRYSRVVESDGTPMTVRTALGIINQVLDEVLAEQEGDFDPDTRWALAWFEQFGVSEGQYGVAETLSKAKNTAINGLVEAGIVKAKAGKVQLLSRAELPLDWNPTTDKRLTVWETTQHLIRTLETQGEGAAAVLLNQLGGIGETARELAYRLYSICERKKWADEALAYNSLVIAWPELSKLAIASRYQQAQTPRQNELFN